MEQPRIIALFGGVPLLGQERGNIEALTALRQKGYEVLCLIRDQEWNNDIRAELDARDLHWEKVHYIEQRMPGRLHYLLFWNPIAFIAAQFQFFHFFFVFRPTHIHAFNPLYVLNFILGLLIVRTPMIYRAGDQPTVHNWVWRILWKFVVRRSNWFVANSDFVARSLQQHGVPKNRISLIYNLPTVRLNSSDSHPELPGKSKIQRVVYVGQVSEHKGVHLLIDAFRLLADQFQDASLVVAGRISDWHGDEWARQLRHKTKSDPVIGHRVAFLGKIANVPGLFAGCSVHVAPSLFEDPSPNVIMEAKQAGLPSIVFPKGGMPELVSDGIDGFVCGQANTQSLIQPLWLYLSDLETLDRHSQAAQMSLKGLGVYQFGQSWQNVYQATSSRATRPPKVRQTMD